jgi:hypothetical protein
MTDEMIVKLALVGVFCAVFSAYLAYIWGRYTAFRDVIEARERRKRDAKCDKSMNG